MDWGIVLGVIGVVGIPLALIGIGIGLAVGAAPSRGEFNFARVCFIVSAIIMAAGVFLTLWNYPEGAEGVRIAVAAIFGALIFGSLAASLDWINQKQTPPKQEGAAPEIEKFSWIWEPLTAGEIEKISSQLRNVGHGDITLAFNPRTAGQLAASFYQIFERAEWTAKSTGPSYSIYTAGITGLGQYPNNAVGRSLEAAIKSYSKLRINFIGLPNVPGEGVSMLIIGAKPPPSPLPDGLKNELTELGKALQDLGASIILFASDRERDKAKLPQFEPGSSVEAVRKVHQARGAFSEDTKALLSQRFQQLDYFLGKLDLIGIEKPFFVQTADSPAALGKWLQMMGQFLENGRVEEARMKGSDNNFWFNQ